MGKQLINKLKAEMKKLRELDKKQRRAEKIKQRAKKEEIKIRKEIADLKSRTSRSLIAKIKKKASSPEAKAKARKSLKIAKKGFARFGKFLENFGE